MSFLIKSQLYILLIISTLNCLSQPDENSYIISDTAEINKAIKTIYSNSDSIQEINLILVNRIQKSSLFLRDTTTFFKFTKKVVRLYFRKKNLSEEAIQFIKESQRMIGPEMNSNDDFNNALGNFYERLNFHSEALEHYYKSISWFEKYDPNNVTIPLGNLAVVYFQNKNLDKALKYNELALENSLKLENKDDRLSNIIFDYFRIGLIYHELGKNDKAESYFKKSLNAGREYDNKGLLLLLAISKALVFYNDLGEVKECSKLILEGDKICDESQKCQANIGVYYALQKNKHYLKIGAFSKAIRPENFDPYNSVHEKEIYLYAINYYNLKKDISKSEEYYNKLIELNEIKTIENRKIAFSNIEEKYANKKLSQKNQELAIGIEKRRKTIILISSILLLISSFLILQLFNNRRYKKLNTLLQLKKEDLEISNDKLAKSNEELECFTFIASHDLKTPLRNIVSFTNLLEKELKLLKNKNIHEYLFYIKEGGKRLNNLISDTLEYSKVSNEELILETEVIDLNRLLDKLETSMQSIIFSKNVKILRQQNLPSITCHYHSMFSLFQNIIENGIKYNKSANPIIKIYTRKSPEFYSIYIEDNGIGIEEEYKDKIFNMFYRLHNHDEYTGSGLGLAISKKILKRLKGEINLQSKEGKGSIFEIRLPSDLFEVKDSIYGSSVPNNV